MDVSDATAMEARLSEISPWLHMKVEDGQWLVIAPSATTTKELSDRVGITGDKAVSQGIVLRVENYYGRNAPSIWEWISTKQGAELGTAAHI